MLTILTIILEVTISGLVCGEVVLSPSSPVATENSSLTLTCTYTGDETVTILTWKAVKKNETTFSNIGIITAECKPFILPVDTSLYEYTCPSSKQYTWTIKKVTRQNAGGIYQCNVDTPSQGVINSNNVVISVKLVITFVELTSPSSSTITVRENTETVFKCKTSGGLPKATITWYKTGGTSGNEIAIIDSQITTSSTTVNGLVEVTGILRYSPSRNENEWRIFCKASNIVGQTPIVSTRKPQMDVQYPPDSPIIAGFINRGEYRIIENTLGNLSYSISGGNPTPTLSWDCYNSGTTRVTSAGTVTKDQIWKAESGKNRTCTCSSSHYSGRKSVTIDIVILYPPNVPIFNIQRTSVSGTVKILRNNALSISCASSGNPPPSYTWTYPNSHNRLGQVLTINHVQSNKRLTCNVKNTMNPTGGVNVTRSNTSYIDVLVLYPPSIPIFNYWNISGQSIPRRSVDVIKGDTFKVACNSNGEPSPAYFWDNNGNNRILTITRIDTDKTSSVCKARNTMSETVGQTLTRSATASLTINVQYPPIAVTLKYSNGETLTNTLSVREGEGFNVTCSSNSNPPPSYNWTGTVSATSSILNINKAVKSHTGSITCNVANLMIRTFPNPEKQKEARVDKGLDLQILYPPIIGEFANKSVAEGSPLTVSCPVIVGNPPQTTFQWLRDGVVWKRSQQFSIEKVTRTDAMFYTCKISNTMVATGERPVSSDVAKSFYLNVWYSVIVEDFYISGHKGQTSIVKNEDDRLQLNCFVDSNPEASISLLYMGNVLEAQTDVKQLTHIIDSVKCTTRGKYSCEGFNDYNENPSYKKIHLFVNCSPRPSPSITLIENVTSAQNVPAVSTFTTLAYPETLEFIWYRWYNNFWQQLSNNEEFRIDTANLQTNLTIKYVYRRHYGKYQLQVKNTIGNYIQPFYLEAEDVPDTPLDFQYIKENVTESSITVQWIPGFDNGLGQTFVLKYKKKSENEWIVVNIRDTGEKKMNYTLTSLSSGTLYELVLFASNRLGNSSQTDVLKIGTSSDDKTVTCSCCSCDSTSAIIVGCLLGIVIIILTLYAGYITLLLKRKDGNKGQNDINLASSGGKSGPTYANLSYLTSDSRQHECIGISNTVNQSSNSDTSEYMALQNQLRDNTETYDVINLNR